MIHERMQYGALACKILTLYGHRLTAADYAAMEQMHSVAEITRYLKAHPGWAWCLSDTDPLVADCDSVERNLSRQYYYEYDKLMRFLGRGDRAFLQLPVYEAEQQYLYTVLRRLIGSPCTPTPFPTELRTRSKLDFDAIEQAETLRELAVAVPRGVYAAPLRTLAQLNQQPSELAVDILLQTALYQITYQTFDTAAHGALHRQLLRHFGQELDLINLTQYLRLRRFYTADEARLYAFPYRRGALLKDAQIQPLLNAPDFATALELVKAGPYRKQFATCTAATLEDSSARLNAAFCRKLLRNTPNIYLPAAYLNLKNIEMQNITRILECAYFHLDRTHTPFQLIGVEE